jgi:membrane protein
MIVERLKLSGAYMAHVMRRYDEVRCLTIAASLSYTSLLALVPMVAISFAVLAAVPALEEFRTEIKGFVFGNLIPASGDTFAEYFDGFVANAGKMTGFGIVGLAVTAIMLINTIFRAINLIFHVEKLHPICLRIGIYVGVLIAAPLVLAASFSLMTYFMVMTKALGVNAHTGFLGYLSDFVPVLILILGFSTFYKVAPNCRVQWRDALTGGFMAGFVFTGVRWLFGFYLIYFPTYQAIYGALSVLPVFLIWMFASWTVILAGAVITASAPSWRGRKS